MITKDKKKAPVAGFLVVRELDEAVKFYSKVFGAEEAERYQDPKGKVWYAVIDIVGSPVQLMEPFRDMGLLSQRKKPTTADSSMLSVSVKDVDETFKRAIRAGALPIIEPQDAYWGDRYAEFRDPNGFRWSTCSEQPIGGEVINPQKLEKKFENFIETHNEPPSPARIVGVKNISTKAPG
jgi:PhnB protein